MAKDDARLVPKSEVKKNDAAAKAREKISDPDGSKKKAADAKRDVERKEFNARDEQKKIEAKAKLDAKPAKSSEDARVSQERAAEFFKNKRAKEVPKGEPISTSPPPVPVRSLSTTSEDVRISQERAERAAVPVRSPSTNAPTPTAFKGATTPAVPVRSPSTNAPSPTAFKGATTPAPKTRIPAGKFDSPNSGLLKTLGGTIVATGAEMAQSLLPEEDSRDDDGWSRAARGVTDVLSGAGTTYASSRGNPFLTVLGGLTKPIRGIRDEFARTMEAVNNEIDTANYSIDVNHNIDFRDRQLAANWIANGGTLRSFEEAKQRQNDAMLTAEIAEGINERKIKRDFMSQPNATEQGYQSFIKDRNEKKTNSDAKYDELSKIDPAKYPPREDPNNFAQYLNYTEQNKLDPKKFPIGDKVLPATIPKFYLTTPYDAANYQSPNAKLATPEGRANAAFTPPATPATPAATPAPTPAPAAPAPAPAAPAAPAPLPPLGSGTMDDVIDNFLQRPTSAGQAPVGQAPVGQAPTKQTPTKQTPTKQTPTKQTPTKQTPEKQAPIKQAPIGQTPTTSAKAQSDQFKRYHRTEFDPNSKLDRQKMKAMQGAGVQMDKSGMGPQAPATRKTLTAANMYDNPNRKYSGGR